MDPVTIFFAALAGFVCFQLYTALGRKDGHESTDQETSAPSRSMDNKSADVVPIRPDVEVDLPAWVHSVRQHYPTFEEKSFIEGATAAYEMIVESFASGKLADVKAYIVPPVFKAFANAVEARESAKQSSEVQFVGIEGVKVTGCTVQDGMIRLTTEFTSNQIRVLRSADKEVLEGDPNRIDLVKDYWTFARSINSTDPNWLLAETGGQQPAAN